MAYTANATRTVTAGELRGDRVRGAATHFHVTGAKPEEKLCSLVAGWDSRSAAVSPCELHPGLLLLADG